jgi:3-hydroxybutyryl-CoA dehydrogenase
MSESFTVGVVGAGIMGRGIALAFALAGRQVRLADTEVSRAESALAGLGGSITTAIDAGRTVENADTIIGRISPVASIAESVDGARLVIEATPEIMEVKRAVWRELGDAASADTVLATNTSSFDVDLLASAARHTDRVLGTHWFNPAHIVPCVEVVPGTHTSPEVVEEVCDLLRLTGKSPNVVRNSAGFIANRIQFAMVREALLCLQEGLAPASVIDEVVRTSFGGRLAAIGPLQAADLGGLDTYRHIFEYLTTHLGERYSVPPLLDRLVEQNRLGVKTAAGIIDYDLDSAAALVAERDRALYRAFDRTNAPISVPSSDAGPAQAASQ